MAFDIADLMLGESDRSAPPWQIDLFGRERNARRSLLLDTITNGRRRVSDSRLVQLPAEILADIVDRLADDKEALANLALTNTDCQQLARSSQFAEIQFDYSSEKCMLLLMIGLEGTPRRLENTSDIGIGRCVRRITFASRPYHVTNANKELHASIVGPEADSYSMDERQRLRAQGNRNYVEIRKLVMAAIGTAMPNLEAFVWKDSFTVDKEFLLSLFRCPVQHVKLDGVTIKDSCLDGPLSVEAWPLRSLDIKAVPESLTGDGESLAALCTIYAKIFQLSAPTLESLHWEDMLLSSGEISFGDSSIPFPRLRLLRLTYVNVDTMLLQSFFTAPLRHIELRTSPIAGAMAALARCESLDNLQSLVFPFLPFEKQLWVDAASFLERHTHIRKLSIREPPEVDEGEYHSHLDQYIIPVLASNRFDNLCSLLLAWGGGSDSVEESTVTQVSTAALAAIGAIVSLEQLCLSSGLDIGPCQWLIDHAQLRHHLQDLRNLKKLALCRDSYYNDPDVNLEQYYFTRTIAANDLVDAVARPELDSTDISQNQHSPDLLWERAHRNRMLTHAEAYAVKLSSLEWVYCGQRPIGIVRDSKNPPGAPKAVPLTTERDACYTFLMKVFGIRTDDD